MFTLKPLSPTAIPSALAKAERYRLLNEPAEAASICEDILRVEPDHADARVTLILALTDQFPHDGRLVGEAHDLARKLPTPYERAYYSGLVIERRARALLERGGGPVRALPAGGWLREAMSCYEEAEAVRPPGNDDALLRWNACARLLNAHAELLEPDDERSAPMMLE
ncbi:MAG: hypothetical protein AB7K63_14270 [Vicinamibacterales bacterium]